MPTGKYSLAQLATINDRNLSGGIADELLEEAPLVRVMASIPASNGTAHKWLRYDDPPPVGFRALNDGIEQGFATQTPVTVNCEILDASYTIDTQAVSGYSFGDLISRENTFHLRSAFAQLEKQVINGTAGSPFSVATGFEGLTNNLGTLANEMVNNPAAGAAANNRTSVYLLRSVNPFTDSTLVLGEDGNITVAPAVRQRVTGDVTGHHGAWFVDISSWYAYQHGGKYVGARICNIDSQAATPAVTDDEIARSYSMFPANRKPNLCVMNRDSERQLRESRTAVNATGVPAPYPDSVHGMQIIVTDQISSNEDAVV